MDRQGNKIVLDGERSYIQNRKSGRKVRIHLKNDVYVLKAKLKNNQEDEIVDVLANEIEGIRRQS